MKPQLAFSTVTTLFVLLAFGAHAGEPLPDGGIATAKGLGAVKAWYEAPTLRYDHGALGDAIEAGSLVAIDDSGQRYTLQLPLELVFEDITPRLADLDGDGINEIVTIRTAVSGGAAVAIYGIKENTLVEKAATATIGRRHRWLSIAAISDFLGTEKRQIAIVKTPHIGGVLELLEFNDGQLKSICPKVFGFTSHVLGSRHLTLATAGDLNGDGSHDLIIPSQDRLTITALNFRNGVKTIANYRIESPVSLPIVVENRRIKVRFEDGRTHTFPRQ